MKIIRRIGGILLFWENPLYKRGLTFFWKKESKQRKPI
jgi:hypothetical protein